MTTVWNTRLLIKSIHHYLILFANTAERLNMIEGISKERLIELYNDQLLHGNEKSLFKLIQECQELNPGVVIDEILSPSNAASRTG
jgi:hypothetical protein